MMGLQDNEAVVNSQEVPMRNGGSGINGYVRQGGPEFAGMHDGQMNENIGVLGV